MLKKIYSSRCIGEAVKNECNAFKASIVFALFIGAFAFIYLQNSYMDGSSFTVMLFMAIFSMCTVCMMGNSIVRIIELNLIKNERSKYDSKLLATEYTSGTVVALVSETCLNIGRHYGSADEYHEDLYMRYRLKIETADGDIIITEPFERMYGRLKDRGEAFSLLGCGDPDVLSYYESTKDNVVGMHCRIYTGYNKCIIKIQNLIFDAY